MTSDNKRILIASIVLAISIILILVFMLLGLNLGIVKFASISSLANKYALVKKSESELNSAQQKYYDTQNTLETSKTEYSKQKNKYSAISDETVDIIKEATTQESYNIEYMWIKLGNYAKKNNLEIVMVEPGGKQNTSSTNSSSTTNSTTNSNTTANTTNKTTTPTTTTTTTTNTSQSTSTSSDSTAFKIQVKGSYMDTSDFIFEVENDSSLKFKLDNISMDYVSGTTIKTSFNVKNLTINK